MGLVFVSKLFASSGIFYYATVKLMYSHISNGHDLV